MRGLFGLCVIFASAGCFSPEYSNGSLQCQSGSHPCPDGYHCATDNTCWKNGQDPAGDMSIVDDGDGGSMFDMQMPDLVPPPPLTYPPAAVWISCGGGAGAAASGNQLGLSACEISVSGTATGSAGSVLTFGYFSDDIF